ncbi:hypothetical protein DFR72_110239 [Lentzea flaviverrucosa]|uniref:Uncharacterized protein n=1 Tax=Lentzea flaviverrucosa TaxID=200379 RepID=A0A1H9VJH5_9PSEU|nr:hypothetical protein DFR72_110239 [Lentzea flaviverrucosa]SES21353.1 hypothetical protein SAMN05216195_11097 [Lentzea flaviverrucosa]
MGDRLVAVTTQRPGELADSVVPLPDEPRHELAWLGLLSAFVASVAFLLLIPAGWSRLDHLWAEDGARFVVDAVRSPALQNLVDPYGGYLHALPRLVAELVALLPLEWTAAGFAVCAAVLRALVALITFSASKAYLRSTPMRFALSSLVIVLPAGNSETLNNMTNLHWFLLFGAFWALLWRNGPRVPVALFVVLAALSSPLVFVLAPIALVRLFQPRREVPIAFLAALAVQGLTMLFASRTPYSHDEVDPVQVLLASLLRVPVVAFTGSERVSQFYPSDGNLVIVAALLAAAVPIAAGLWFGDRPARALSLVAGAYSVVVIVACLVLNWTQVLQVQAPDVVMAGQRYSIAPCLFLFTAIFVGLDATPSKTWQRLVVGGSRYLIGFLVVVSIFAQFRETKTVLTGIPWDESLARARAECAAGASEARLEHEPKDWFFVVPCESVR